MKPAAVWGAGKADSAGMRQRLRLVIEKMSGKSRSRYQEFLEEKVQKIGQSEEAKDARGEP